MGTFSIWHWLIVLLVLLFIFGLPTLAVAKENSNLRTNRREFLLWIVAYIGIPFVIGFIGALLDEADISQLIGVIFGLAIIYPLYQRFVRRARDVGMGKTIAYLSIVPLVNIITTLILLFKGSQTGSIEVGKPKKQPVANRVEKNNTVEGHRIETPILPGKRLE